MIFTYVYGCTTAVTLVALGLYMFILFNVGRARGKYGIAAPAVHGSEAFERVHRVQVNTTEQMVLFLPLLWLSAVLVGDLFAGVIGIIWPVARLAYALAYYRDAKRRSAGFMIGMLVDAVLFAGAIFGLVTYTTVTAALQ